jgi:hypothetical protein
MTTGEEPALWLRSLGKLGMTTGEEPVRWLRSLGRLGMTTVDAYHVLSHAGVSSVTEETAAQWVLGRNVVFTPRNRLGLQFYCD